MRRSIRDLLREKGRFVIDGSMSTALEEMGADLNCALWTARVLAERPELVRRVHTGYFRAGADCGITCSYQATIPGLVRSGYTGERAAEIIESSVRLFLEAREDWWTREGKASGRAYPLCLAGMGPYGAYLADGSEYRGGYDVTEEALRAFHAPRAKLLWEAGADALLFETQPSLREVLVEAEIAEELGAEYAVSFSCRDGSRTNEGDDVLGCVQALSEGHPHLAMIGVNCTKPEHIRALIRRMREGTALPIAVYPNSGREYDPADKTWHGDGSPKRFREYALSYFEEGASAVGGCCTTDCTHIREVCEARERFLAPDRPKRITAPNRIN